MFQHWDSTVVRSDMTWQTRPGKEELWDSFVPATRSYPTGCDKMQPALYSHPRCSHFRPAETDADNTSEVPGLLRRPSRLGSIADVAPCFVPELEIGKGSETFSEFGLVAPQIDCQCCHPAEVAAEVETAANSHINPAIVLRLVGDLQEVIDSGDHDLPAAVERTFGPDGITAMFGRRSAEGIARLRCGGFNHVFMLALGGKLVKCIRPHGGAGGQFSEALEADRLTRSSPNLAKDPHVLFPDAFFLCQDAASSAFICEVLVFEYLPNCQSIADVWSKFERTHPCGSRHQASPCPVHRAEYSEVGPVRCEHAKALRSLVRQAALLGRRFQALHGRRHGDFKADNVLIDQHGRLRLADFLSPFCVSCDRGEFCTSLQSQHPSCQELQAAFNQEWQAASKVYRCEDMVTGQNVWLIAELDKLQEAFSQQPLFGPLPDLLQSISTWTPSSTSTQTPSSFSFAGGTDWPSPASQSPSPSPIAQSPETGAGGMVPPHSVLSAELSNRNRAVPAQDLQAWRQGNASSLVSLSSSLSFSMTSPARQMLAEPNLLTQARSLLVHPGPKRDHLHSNTSAGLPVSASFGGSFALPPAPVVVSGGGLPGAGIAPATPAMQFPCVAQHLAAAAGSSPFFPFHESWPSLSCTKINL
eukprot:s4266_g5.t2